MTRNLGLPQSAPSQDFSSDPLLAVNNLAEVRSGMPGMVTSIIDPVSQIPWFQLNEKQKSQFSNITADETNLYVRKDNNNVLVFGVRSPSGTGEINPVEVQGVKPESSSAARTALVLGGVGLEPDEAKALATSFLPTAQNIVDKTWAPFIKSAPPLQLKLLSAEQMKANNPGENMDGTIAYTDTGRPGVIYVGYESPAFKKFGVDEKDLKLYLVHEVMHTRSAAFSDGIVGTYGKPLANGKPATFSDGTLVHGITEGVTELYTLLSTQQKKSASSPYNSQIKWALKVFEKVGPDTMASAYFGNEPASMKKVKKAIDELIAEDKRAPASTGSR